MTERRRVASGSPYEPIVGFSRAVRTGHHVSVAGTAPIMPDGGDPPADAFAQARRCLEIVVTGFIDPRWLVEIEADAIVD